jgi:hypothetical protein
VSSFGSTPSVLPSNLALRNQASASGLPCRIAPPWSKPRILEMWNDTHSNPSLYMSDVKRLAESLIG